MVTGVITHTLIEVAVATEFSLLENCSIEKLFLSPKYVKTERTKVMPGKKFMREKIPGKKRFMRVRLE